jgi:hypothetical protein
MVEATCHCGAVSLELAHAPAQVTDCNCSICRRYGVLWAYYPVAEVRISAPEGTDTYSWGEKGIAFHRCKTCGCVTHWAAAEGPGERVGVNARLLPPEIRAGARVRHLDGADTWEYLD